MRVEQRGQDLAGRGGQARVVTVDFGIMTCELCCEEKEQILLPDSFDGHSICISCAAALTATCPSFARYLDDLESLVVTSCHVCAGSGKCIYISDGLCIPCLGTGRFVKIKAPLTRLAEQA